MKKMLILMVVLSLAVLASGAVAAGARDGSGPLCTAGDPVEFTGTLVNYLGDGGGIILLTVIEGVPTEIVLYGIGPARYWDDLGVDRPAVDEEITVNGYIVNCGGVERYILTSVLIEETLVGLRDETGRPLWRSLGRSGDAPYGPVYGKEGGMGAYGPAYGKSGDMGEYGPGYGKNEETGHFGPGSR